jgi:flagellar basal body-associated protein FliL
MKKQSGFAGLELLVVVVIVIAVAFVGYYVWHGNNVKSTPLVPPVANSSTTTSAPVTTPPAPQITTASNLNQAMQALNGTSVSSNSTDSSQLTTQSQGF